MSVSIYGPDAVVALLVRHAIAFVVEGVRNLRKCGSLGHSVVKEAISHLGVAVSAKESLILAEPSGAPLARRARCASRDRRLPAHAAPGRASAYQAEGPAMIETTYRRYGLSLDARIDTRNASDPDCRAPEVEPVEIVDHDELFAAICCDNAKWDSFLRWLKTPAIAKDFAEWVDQTFGHDLLQEACEE